jgi:hypothetical protein
MRRFVGALALVAVAGAIYVAAAPGAQQAGPTAKQFAALKKTVTKLQKQVKAATNDANGALGLVLVCVMHQPVAVDAVGSSTDGYLFGAPGVTPEEATTALNLAAATEASPQYRMYVVNTTNSGCVDAVNQAATLTSAHLFAFGKP